jgi:hypothetical protein
LVSERIKSQEYQGVLYSHNFWRLSSGAELDLVEDAGGQLIGFEFKYGKKVAKAPPSWVANYPEARFATINRQNYLDFLLLKT